MEKEKRITQTNYCIKLINHRSSAAAGVGCALASLPPDNLKTKL